MNYYIVACSDYVTDHFEAILGDHCTLVQADTSEEAMNYVARMNKIKASDLTAYRQLLKSVEHNIASEDSDESIEESDDEEISKIPSPAESYHVFLGRKMKEFRKSHPGLAHSEYLSMAAEAWEQTHARPYTHAHGPKRNNNTEEEDGKDDTDDEIGEPKNKSSSASNPTTYNAFAAKRIGELKKSYPGLAQREYMEEAAKLWNAPKKRLIDEDDNNDDSEPKSAPKTTRNIRKPTEYNIFAGQKMKELKTLYPGRSQREYMSMTAEAWLEAKSHKKTDEVDEVDDVSVPKSGKSKPTKKSSSAKSQSKPTAYNVYIGAKIKELKQNHPNLSTREYMMMAAKEWQEEKNMKSN